MVVPVAPVMVVPMVVAPVVVPAAVMVVVAMPVAPVMMMVPVLGILRDAAADIGRRLHRRRSGRSRGRQTQSHRQCENRLA